MDITEIKSALAGDLKRIDEALVKSRSVRDDENETIKRLLEERKEAVRLVNATKPRKKRADAQTPIDTGV